MELARLAQARLAAGLDIGHAGEQLAFPLARVVCDAALGIEDHRLPLAEIISGPARIAGAREADEGVHDAVAHRLLCRRRLGHRAEAEADVGGVFRVLEVELVDEGGRAGAPAFVYQLDFEDAKHTADIGLSFGTMPEPTSAEQAMSDRVMDAFVRFARTGDPGWAAYDLGKRQTMIFDTESRVANDPRQWERELFARVPYIQPGS